MTLATRTTRAVRLTEAGGRLFESLSGPMKDIGSALEATASDVAPRGHLRIAATSIAESFLSGGLIGSFVAAYPVVTLDITVTDEEFDIVAAGYDAGVRLGELIEQDMVAVPISGMQRELVAAAPAYLARHRTPKHPRELLDHCRIGWRRAPNLAPYRWEFKEDGVPFDIEVHPQVTTNDLRLMLRPAIAGTGVTFLTEARRARRTFGPGPWYRYAMSSYHPCRGSTSTSRSGQTWHRSCAR